LKDFLFTHTYVYIYLRKRKFCLFYIIIILFNILLNFLVLYKEGPPFFHASYIVIVEVVDADSLVIESTLSTRSTWDSLFRLQRLSETAAKV